MRLDYHIAPLRTHHSCEHLKIQAFSVDHLVDHSEVLKVVLKVGHSEVLMVVLMVDRSEVRMVVLKVVRSEVRMVVLMVVTMGGLVDPAEEEVV